MTQELIITSGAAWRAPRVEGFLVRLPSGNVVRMRPVALDVLMLSGKLPDILTGIAAKTLWETADDVIGNQAETAKNFADLVGVIVTSALMYPRIVENPQADDEISSEDIDFGDKVAVFQLATQPAEILRRFRAGQTANVEPVSNSQDDVQPAE